MFSRKTFRYLSFAWPKLRQVALLCGGSLKYWPVSTLHLLQPAWCSWLFPWVEQPQGTDWDLPSGKGSIASTVHRAHAKSSCCQNPHGQQTVLHTFFTEIKSPCCATSDHHHITHFSCCCAALVHTLGYF